MTEIPSLLTREASEPAYGAWINTRDATLVEAAALAGFDYVCIDMQHGLAGPEGVVDMIAAMARTSAVPLVRVAQNDAALIGRVLDAGAMGVIVPLVNGVDDVRRAVTACRYAPSGNRSIGPFGVTTRYGFEYLLRANDIVACFPMIETLEALDAVEEIAATPGVGGLYLGPGDLSMAMGLLPGVDQTDERFVNAVDTVRDACHRHGIIAGIHSTADVAPKRAGQGFGMITCTTDLQAAVQAMTADLHTVRAAVASS
jgi:4-hydroxy-2-oxoheptanedioate aldolase